MVEEVTSSSLPGKYRGGRVAVENPARSAVEKTMPIEITACAFCSRVTRTRGHHLVPRSKGGREVRPTCESCEDFIHSTWSHNELRDAFGTVEKIRADPRYERFLKWLLKQPATTVYASHRGRGRAGDRYK